MIAGATDAGICLFDFQYRKSIEVIQDRIRKGLQDEFVPGDHPLLDELESEMDAYFKGTLKAFTIPIHPVGSPFQLKVWDLLRQIPYGKHRSYLQQARELGDEKAIRAVATANGMNGIAILIPCHRVLGSNGSLTGYAGGLSAKRWLLDHEAKQAGLEQQGHLF